MSYDLMTHFREKPVPVLSVLFRILLLAYTVKHKLTMKHQNNKTDFEKRCYLTGRGEYIFYASEIIHMRV